MTSLYTECTCNKLMMGSLIFILFNVGMIFFDNSATHKWMVLDTVHFIKRNPVLYLVFVSCEYCSCKFNEKVNQLTIGPTTVFCY
ncbi:hypothetical protein D3C77_464200 [compost metagenome]